MVPMLTCGLLRSNFSLLMCSLGFVSGTAVSPDPGLNRRPHPYQGCALPSELSGPVKKRPSHSGKWDSNPRHSAWKADALPTELFPQVLEGEGFEPSKA